MITLRDIALDSTLLFGPLPPELGLLANLERFSARACFFSGVIPVEFGSLTKLKSLNLARNAPLTGVIPTELGQLPLLETLLLNENALTGTIPTELGQITTLLEVQLGNNKLTGNVPEQVCAVAADPSLLLDILVVDCAVVCDLEACCSECIPST